VAGYFSKVHDFRAKHVVFCEKLPRFWGLVYSAGTKRTCRSSILPEGENRRGRVAWFSPAHEIYNAHKALHEDYFFREVGPGRKKKGFFPSLWL
jgi:hypothetical protein